MQEYVEYFNTEAEALAFEKGLLAIEDDDVPTVSAIYQSDFTQDGMLWVVEFRVTNAKSES